MLIIAQSPLEKAATLMNLTFFFSQFPLCSWAISYTALCAFVWLFFLFYFPLFNPIHYPEPFCASTIRAHKALHSGWGFLHILSSSPLGCRIGEEYLEKAFSFCAQEARQTLRGESRWGTQLKDKCFWEALTPKAKLFGGLIVLPYAWICASGTLKWKEGLYYLALMQMDAPKYTTKNVA